jgi:hypothetical protein
LKEGKPIGNINYSFYQDSNKYYILGAFVKTEKRILFFPAITDRRTTRSPDGKEPLKDGILHHIDHITLEDNLRNYHVTLDEKATKGTRYKNMNTTRVDDNMFLWLVMGIQNASALQLAPKTQEIRVHWHNYSDLTRRCSVIEKSRGDCEFVVTRVDDQPDQPFYLNFEIFVSNIQSKEYEPPLKVHHIGLSSYNTIMKDPRSHVLTRAHYIILKGFNGAIWIRVSKVIGSLDNHAVFLFR